MRRNEPYLYKDQTYEQEESWRVQSDYLYQEPNNYYNRPQKFLNPNNYNTKVNKYESHSDETDKYYSSNMNRPGFAVDKYVHNRPMFLDSNAGYEQRCEYREESEYEETKTYGSNWGGYGGAASGGVNHHRNNWPHSN